MLCDRAVSEPVPVLRVVWTQAEATAAAKADQRQAPTIYEKHVGIRALTRAALEILGMASVPTLVAYTDLDYEAVATAVTILRRGREIEHAYGDGTRGNPRVWRIREAR
jgi:hypothetical protein